MILIVSAHIWSSKKNRTRVLGHQINFGFRANFDRKVYVVLLYNLRGTIDNREISTFLISICNMKALITLILTTYLYSLSHGVYLAYPTARNLCEQSDFRAGVELVGCTLTWDTNMNHYYYSYGYCDKYMMHVYGCNSLSFCNTDLCKPLGNVSLGCESTENIFFECVQKLSDVSKLLGTKSYLTISKAGSGIECPQFSDYVMYPINRCLQTRSRSNWPSIDVKCNSTHTVISEYIDEECQQLYATQVYPLNTCVDGIEQYSCQGF